MPPIVKATLYEPEGGECNTKELIKNINKGIKITVAPVISNHFHMELRLSITEK
jgi:hypothetical protein